jgi:predicted ribosome quality control (RQC) complex YloA/Tae2 family protein
MMPKETNNDTLPYRHFIIDDLNVYIGKNDTQNDELSMVFGRPWDIWMHVSSLAGSHVVIQREKGAAWPPKETLERAASLAAWFSKARNARLVKVQVTEVRFVHKLKHAPPGEVQIRKFKTFRVTPVDPQVLFPPCGMIST